MFVTDINYKLKKITLIEFPFLCLNNLKFVERKKNHFLFKLRVLPPLGLLPAGAAASLAPHYFAPVDKLTHS
jgi:hypothetical protein